MITTLANAERIRKDHGARAVHVRARTRAITAIGVILGVLVATLTGASATASTASTKCGAFAVLITVRGVDAAGGSRIQNGRVWLSGGNGAQLDPLVAKMKSSAPFPVWTESLAWDANMSSNDYYEARVNQGMNLLVAEINSIISSCKASVIPHILLAGHSAGADIVSRTLWYFSGSSNQSYIDGSVVYGDPSTSNTQNWNAKGVTSSTGFFHRPNDRTTAINSTFRYYGWSFDHPTIQKPTYYSRARAYCNTDDWACRNPLAGLWNSAAHNAYTGKTSDAYNWFMFLLTDFG